MGLAKRIIPCLDVDNGRVVKGVNFVDIRDAGDPGGNRHALQRAGRRRSVPSSISPPATRAATPRCTRWSRSPSKCSFRSPSAAAFARCEDIRTMLNAGADKVEYQHRGHPQPGAGARSGRAFWLPVYRGGDRRQAGGRRGRPAALGDIHPRRSQTHRHRRGGLGGANGGAGRGGDPADQHGPGRHQQWLRAGCDPRRLPMPWRFR